MDSLRGGRGFLVAAGSLRTASLFEPTDALGDGVLFVILFHPGTALAPGLLLALNHRRLARINNER